MASRESKSWPRPNPSNPPPEGGAKGVEREVPLPSLCRRVEDARPGQRAVQRPERRLQQILRRDQRQGSVQGRRPGPAVEDVEDWRVRNGHTESTSGPFVKTGDQ